MENINEQVTNLLKSQIVKKGVCEIESAFDNHIPFRNKVIQQIKLDGSITEQTLLDLIHEFYDFNEFGGFTTDLVSNLMDVLMPMYFKMRFINDVQGEMLNKASELINEKHGKVVTDVNDYYDSESNLRSYLNG